MVSSPLMGADGVIPSLSWDMYTYEIYLVSKPVLLLHVFGTTNLYCLELIIVCLSNLSTLNVANEGFSRNAN